MKAKLINGKLQYAPKIIKYNDAQYIGGAPEEVFTALGYKDVINTERPETEMGFHAESHWEELENSITQVWEIVEDSPQNKVAELKQKLFDTDYQAIKYAEGWISEEEYAPMKAQRQTWRDEINELENV